MTAGYERQLKETDNLNQDMVAVGNVNRSMQQQIDTLNVTLKSTQVKLLFTVRLMAFR